MVCSCWWRGMADLPGVVAGVGVALTVVPSLGRGGRRKWPNLVVIWQLGGGREGGFEITVQGGVGVCGADQSGWKRTSLLNTPVGSLSYASSHFGILEVLLWWPPAHGNADRCGVRKGDNADSTRTWFCGQSSGPFA